MKMKKAAWWSSAVLVLGLTACVAAEKPATGVITAAEVSSAAVPVQTQADRAPTGQPVVSKKTQPEVSTTESNRFAVQLKRGACFGRCPQYVVRIEADGRVTFNGERFVAALGEQHGQADPAAWDALLALLRQPAVAALKDIYRPGQAGCGSVTTDMPSSEIEWQLDGRQHRLRLYGGCAAMPPLAQQLPAAVDQAAGVRMWIEQGVDR